MRARTSAHETSARPDRAVLGRAGDRGQAGEMGAGGSRLPHSESAKVGRALPHSFTPVNLRGSVLAYPPFDHIQSLTRAGEGLAASAERGGGVAGTERSSRSDLRRQGTPRV